MRAAHSLYSLIFLRPFAMSGNDNLRTVAAGSTAAATFGILTVIRCTTFAFHDTQSFQNEANHEGAPAFRIGGRTSAARQHPGGGADQQQPIAIVALDGQHRFMTANPAFLYLFGYTPDDFLSNDFDEMIAAPGMEEESRQLSRSVLQGDKVHVVTHRRRRNGTIIRVEISGIPLMEDGRLAGVYALYQDLTERTQAEDALRAMADRVEAAQEYERRRIARDLHDSTSQELTALIWNLNRLIRLVEGQNETVKSLVHQTREIASQCSARIRSASYLMHPPELQPGGLTQALPLLAEGFEERSGIPVELTVDRGLGRFRQDVELTLFRMVQEGLTNVLRHSNSSRVQVSLNRSEGQLLLHLSDDGARPSSPDCPPDGIQGVGLRGMQERAQQLGGTFHVHHQSHGTSLWAAVPAIEGSSSLCVC